MQESFYWICALSFVSLCALCITAFYLYKLKQLHKKLDKSFNDVVTYTNKTCPQCHCQYLSPLRSLNIKKCTACGYEMEWKLDPGQLPLVANNRMVKRDEKN